MLCRQFFLEVKARYSSIQETLGCDRVSLFCIFVHLSECKTETWSFQVIQTQKTWPEAFVHNKTEKLSLVSNTSTPKHLLPFSLSTTHFLKSKTEESSHWDKKKEVMFN